LALARFAGAAFVGAVEVEVDPARCAFPWRCVGTELGAFFSAVPAVRREFLRAEAGVDPVPETGSGPSARRWSWWSELMHLTSVDRHDNASRGEEAGPM